MEQLLMAILTELKEINQKLEPRQINNRNTFTIDAEIDIYKLLSVSNNIRHPQNSIRIEE